MKIWHQILEKLKENKTVYLLTVIQNSGSSPGRKGFKMMISDDNFIFGSVGGGIMEFTLVEEAKRLLQEENPSIFIKKQIHKGSIKDGSGMICSGEQTVAFHPLNKNDISVIEDVTNYMKNGKKGIISLTPTSFHFSDKKLDNKFDFQINTKEDWFYKEQIGFKETLYIIGGGHISISVSEIFKKLGFYVIVFDNRENLNTLENNNFAHQKMIVNYNEIDNFIKESNNSYVAIMTNKYTEDKLVLSKLIRNNFQFIGVLGSKAKLKTMWSVLLKEGFTQKELDKIYAPIGLSIKSETPIEIAISIAAQIIKTRNKKS